MTIQTPTSCPDDRLALAAQGAIDAAEWEVLKVHLDGCADCTAAWIAARAFDGSGGAEPADEHLVRDAARAALAEVSSSSRRRRPLRPAAAAAVAVALLATGASAGVFIGLRARSVPAAVDPGTAGARDRGPDRAPGAHRPPAVNPVAPPAAIETPPVPPAATEALAARPVATPSRLLQPPGSAGHRPGAEPLAESPAPSHARALFARATAARQAGRFSEAIALFRRLDAESPDAPEAIVSRVSLGELLAEGGDAPGALASFDAYLGAAPNGPLVPEALAARARLLARLGRTVEARRSWDELGRRFPDSPYLSRRKAGADGAP